MKTITFIRHAQSEANIGGISQPNAEINLSEAGVQQAKSLASCWNEKPEQVYISEFNRTLQTASPLAENLR